MYLPLPSKVVDNFPQLVFEKISLNSSATDTLIKVAFSTNISNREIINKNNIKLKLFLISSLKMENDFLLMREKSIPEIEKVLQDNNFIYSDDDCNLLQSEAKINYKTNFRYSFAIPTNPVEENKFLSIGAIFYIDKVQYLEKINTSAEFVDDKSLCGTLSIYKIYNNSGETDKDNIDKIFDYRMIGKSKSLSYEIQQTLEVPNPVIFNPKKEVDNKYFSELYVSRYSSNIRSYFNFNYDQLVYDKCQYNKFINNLSSEEIKQIFKLNHIKILKKQIYNDKTFEDPNSFSVIPKSFIRENKIYDNLSTYSFIDNKVTIGCQYRYGVEVSFSDKTIDILKNIRDNVNYLIKTSKEYLNLFYDLINNDTQTLEKKKQVYRSNIQQFFILASEVFTLLFTKINVKNSAKFAEMYQKIFINPFESGALIEDMNIAISYLQKIVNDIEKNIDTIKSTNIIYTYWFKTIEIDNLSYGYNLLSDEITDTPTIIFNKTTTFDASDMLYYSKLKNIFENNKKHYNITETSNTDLSYHTPLQVSLNGKKTNLRSNVVVDFKNLFAKIKQYKSENEIKESGNLTDVYLKNLSGLNISIENYEEITEKVKTPTYIPQKNIDGFSFVNEFSETVVIPQSIQDSKIQNTKINEKIDLSNLCSIVDGDIKTEPISTVPPDAPYQVKSFLKLYSATQLPIKTIGRQISLNDSYTMLPELDAKQPSADRKKLDPTKNLDQVFKFIFYYDSVHAIQYFNNNKQSWELLTLDIINNMKESQMVMCRFIKHNTSNYFKYDNYDKISLPLYGQYFIFVKNSITEKSNVSFTPTQPTGLNLPSSTLQGISNIPISNSSLSSAVVQGALDKKKIDQLPGMSIVPISPKMEGAPQKKQNNINVKTKKNNTQVRTYSAPRKREEY